MKIFWSPNALRQITEIFDYLNELNPPAAARVFIALIEAGNGLAIFPHRGRPVGIGEIREILPSYPYIVRYRVMPEMVEIVGVRHTAREPTQP